MMDRIQELLGDDRNLLEYECRGISRDRLHLPGPDFIDRVFIPSDRPVRVLRNLRALYSHGRLGGTGYLSILPVDQGVEHSAGASFAPNPDYFDPANIIRKRRSCKRRPCRRHQQTCRRHRDDHRAQGLSETPGRRHRAFKRRSGRLSVRGYHRCLNERMKTENIAGKEKQYVMA